MEVLYASNSGCSQPRVLADLKAARSNGAKFTVVDLGGAASPWSAEVADAFVDLNPNGAVPTIAGDLHDPDLWRRIKARNFDFCICSHTLEDLRDPLFVLAQIRETFRHGYIAVPNKHVEFGHIESSHYVGYGHHRWIFTLAAGELRVIAKWPLASYFSPRRAPLLRFKANRMAQAYRRLRGRKLRLSEGGPLPWWQRELSDRGNELAFIWKGPLAFHSIGSDYAGGSIEGLADLYRKELATGL